MITSGIPVSTRVHVAVVHGPDMEPFVAMGASRRQVVRRLSRYVARHAPHLLWPTDAHRVADLLAARDLEGAVNMYFHALGDPRQPVRWGRQRVVYRSLRWPGSGGVQSCRARAAGDVPAPRESRGAVSMG
jgi:hypothetical protein